MTIGRLSKPLVVLIISLSALTGCAEFLDGPHNRGKEVIPGLLLANNGTDFVTYWDEASQSYRTYDQTNNKLLTKAIFEVKPEPSQNYLMTASAVMPLTALDEEDMHIQKEQGCVACHET